jgi:hypothetical protein
VLRRGTVPFLLRDQQFFWLSRLSRIRLAALRVPGPGVWDHLRPAARPGTMNEKPAPEHGWPAAAACAVDCPGLFLKAEVVAYARFTYGEKGDRGRQEATGSLISATRVAFQPMAISGHFTDLRSARLVNAKRDGVWPYLA